MMIEGEEQSVVGARYPYKDHREYGVSRYINFLGTKI
jgi:hypothetical protein